MLNETVLDKVRALKEEAKTSTDGRQGAEFQARLTTMTVGAIADLAEMISEIERTTRTVQIENPTTTVKTDVDKVIEPLQKSMKLVETAVLGNKPISNENLAKLLADLITKMEKLPTELPKVPDFPKMMKVEQTNQIDLRPALEELKKAVEATEHTYKPTIKVPEPQIKTVRESQTLIDEVRALKDLMTQVAEKEMPETNIKPLKAAMDKVTKAVNDIKFPIPPTMPRTLRVTNPDGTWLSGGGSTSPEYASKVDIVGNYTYIAEALPGTSQASANWRVRRVEQVGDTTTVTWADGNNSFDNLATDLTVLAYS